MTLLTNENIENLIQDIIIDLEIPQEQKAITKIASLLLINLLQNFNDIAGMARRK
jgi:hypothetical protein